jgi:hypothetical protein
MVTTGPQLALVIRHTIASCVDILGHLSSGFVLMDIPRTEHAYCLQVLRTTNSILWNVDLDASTQVDLSAFDLAQPWRSLHACRAVRLMHFRTTLYNTSYGLAGSFL